MDRPADEIIGGAPFFCRNLGRENGERDQNGVLLKDPMSMAASPVMLGHSDAPNRMRLRSLTGMAHVLAWDR